MQWNHVELVYRLMCPRFRIQSYPIPWLAATLSRRVESYDAVKPMPVVRLAIDRSICIRVKMNASDEAGIWTPYADSILYWVSKSHIQAVSDVNFLSRSLPVERPWYFNTGYKGLEKGCEYHWDDWNILHRDLDIGAQPRHVEASVQLLSRAPNLRSHLVIVLTKFKMLTSYESWDSFVSPIVATGPCFISCENQDFASQFSR